MRGVAGVHLTLTDDKAAEIDALAELLGGRVGLPGVLDRLDRQARPSRLGRLAGRLVDEAYAWDREDARDRRWWPQGVSGSADADPSERVLGRRLLLVSQNGFRCSSSRRQHSQTRSAGCSLSSRVHYCSRGCSKRSLCLGHMV